MDFGVPGLESLVVGHENGAPSRSSFSETNQKGVGSGFNGKQERSGSGEEEWSSSKMSKTDGFSVSKTVPFRHGIPLLRSNSLIYSGNRQEENMLSFSSAKPEGQCYSKTGGLGQRNSPTSGVPYSLAYTRNAGYGNGSLNASMQCHFNGVKGPFTPSQWIELEHQALIYKYITANYPVPPNLLLSLKKSLFSYGFAGSAAGSLPPNSLGWGNFHLGFSSNTDPEPGRCRRTDGKKWRCSRDAVADQKYCERHINRGRHRSRKPVEGQSGQAISSGPTGLKVVQPMTTSSSSLVPGSGGAYDSFTITQQQHQLKNFQPGDAANPSADSLSNRVQDTRGLSMKSEESTFTVPLKDFPFHETSQPEEFGLVSSDSLLNPSQRSPYVDISKNYTSYINFNDHETQDQPLRQFIDDWPKHQTDNNSVIAWPEERKPDWTRLSMSIPTQDHIKLACSSSSPHRSSCNITDGSKNLNNGWIPMSWGSDNNSMGGPLGEVLITSTTNSPRFGSSPTGVLQKSTFGSNSSSVSSPVADHNRGNDLYDDLLVCSTLPSSSIPSL